MTWTLTVRDSRRFDWDAMKNQIPIEAVAVNLLGEPPGRGGSRGLWWPCPFHQDRNPSFQVQPEKGERGRWICRAGCGSGDDIALVRKLEGLDFPQAVRRLAAMFGFEGEGFQAPASRPRVARPKPKPKTPAVDPIEALARRHWAMGIALDAVERLWSPEGREALAYLRGRGFSESMIGLARLGFVRNHMVPKSSGGYMPLTGIAIPWFDADGHLAKINVRRFGDVKARYIEAFRDHPVSYRPLVKSRPDLPLVITEGELDCLLLAQELGDLADAVSTGSASSKPSPKLLLEARLDRPLYLAVDADGAGDSAASHWPSWARRVLPLLAKDWGDLHKSDPTAIRRLWSKRLAPPAKIERSAAVPFAAEPVAVEPPSEAERLDALMGGLGFSRVDPSALDALAEFDPPIVDPPAVSVSRARERTGKPPKPSPSLFDQIHEPGAVEAVAETAKPQTERPTDSVQTLARDLRALAEWSGHRLFRSAAMVSRPRPDSGPDDPTVPWPGRPVTPHRPLPLDEARRWVFADYYPPGTAPF